MDLLNIIILGIIQGLTEFIPVSSSGHLSIAQKLMGLEEAQINIFTIVALHFASLLAVLVYYRKDFRKLFTQNTYEIGYLILGSIPAGIIGLVFKEYIENTFSQITFVSIFLIATGVFLYIVEHLSREKISLKGAGLGKIFTIGIAQAFAILPGLSRSGLTIGSGFLLGIKKAEAIRFSFFLGSIAIFGASLLKLKDFIHHKVDINFVPIIVGIAITFLLSLVSIKLVEVIAMKNKLRILSIYCFLVGFITLIYFCW